MDKNNSNKRSFNILYRNINEFNTTLLVVLGVLIVMLSGFTSYALFTDEVVSNNIIKLTISSKEEVKTFSYTGECEEYTVPYNGYYKVEAWGAQGGNGYKDDTTKYTGGKGAYTSGIIKLLKGETLYVCVGGAGSYGYGTNVKADGGFNGGGASYTASSAYGGTGGGATDIRLVNGTSWDDEEGLNSRIMVAAGGGGGYNYSSSYYGIGGDGGGLIGGSGYGYYNGTTYTSYGGTQIATNFGYGASYSQAGIPGAGSGYYGGNTTKYYSASGGSSFISGYAGVNAITSSTDRTHTNDTVHYSNKYFINGTMEKGVRSGDGEAKITFISGIKPERTNTNLNNVRYIKDCMNGSSENTGNHWLELQALYNGVNVAKGTEGAIYAEDGSIVSSYNTTTRAYSLATDGDITAANYTYGTTKTGNQCFIIDLGDYYDLDEIAIWHYWTDGRTYTNNYTYVSSDNSNWTKVIDIQEGETSGGKRVNAYS